MEAALDELFGKGWFDVCNLGKIMEILNVPRGEAYQLLNALHCIHYANMKPELRDRVPALVAECLRSGSAERAATRSVMDAIEITLK